MSKHIIICCDGTWSNRDHKDRGKVSPSNVVHMARAIAPIAPDGTHQVVYYHPGVGTYWGQQLIGGAFGIGITQNIEDVYCFLVDNYHEGDKIFLFGFSRGAYTARSIAGLMRNCGILYKRHAARFKEAYDLYRRRDEASKPNGEEAKQFRKDYSREEFTIKFLGVWDTVGSLGIPFGPLLRHLTKRYHEFHDVTLSRIVENAYHAMAIDERRKHFEPTLWEKQPDAENQILEQVWFAGTHSNVGGGYVDRGLSDIAFIWMKEKAEACGLAFAQEYITDNICVKLDKNIRGELRNSKTGIFRLLGDYIRPIGAQTNGFELVHASVKRRYEDSKISPAYRPENLTGLFYPHELVVPTGR